MSNSQRGFTLIEIMIAVAIIGILSAIAYPNYTDYVLRGKIADATNTLASARASLEQYYQDNRTYVTTPPFTSPCSTLPALKDFTVTCNPVTATTYTVQAIGKNTLVGWNYYITQANVQTSDVAARWGGATGNACWIVKKGGTC